MRIGRIALAAGLLAGGGVSQASVVDTGSSELRQ
jgi:hypothetical protein